MAISNIDREAIQLTTKEERPVTFELAMKELQTIVSQLDAGQLSLTESLACFERGTNLLKQCQQELDAAERKIEILTGFNAEGEPVTEPFNAVDTLESREQKAGRRKSSTRKNDSKTKSHNENQTDDQPHGKNFLF